METIELNVDTSTKKIVDITSQCQNFSNSKQNGLLNVFVPHATAGLAIIETGSGSEQDLIVLIDNLLPKTSSYTHRHGSMGHGRDHILPALISPSMTVPVINGSLVLGTWQSIVVVDTNVDNPHRKVILSFLS